MKQIVVRKFGMIHYHAICYNCSFSAAIQTPETKTAADVLRAVRRHVRKTGHMVSVENGSATHYSLTREDKQ